MRLFPARGILIRVAFAFGQSVGFAFALAAVSRAQSSATAYYWSAYPNADAKLPFTTGVAVDQSGNVYASLVGEHYVAKITTPGEVSVLAGTIGASGFADGAGAAARFNAPQGLVVDGAGNVFVAEFGSSTIRKISSAGVVSTLAGLAGVVGATDGPAASARFNAPRGVAVDGVGNVYVTDWTNARVRIINLGNQVQTIAGSVRGTDDGVGTIARFQQPWGIAADRIGTLYVTDSLANTVRKIAGPLRVVSTLAGTPGLAGSIDGAGATARFNQPTGVAVDDAGNVFVTDTQNRTIRRIGTDGQVATIGGRADAPAGADNGIGGAATFVAPYAIAVTSTGTIYVADYVGIRRGEPVRGPAIAVQPAGFTVQAGATASLTVVASGSPPPTYQWRLNGEVVAGATRATLTFDPVGTQHGGDYTVEVKNSLGTVTSTVATMTVNAPPAISAAPRATTIGADGTAQLGVAATGTGPFSYQWSRDGAPIAGATNASLRTGDYGNYAVAVTNSHGTTTTTPVLVDFPARLANLSTSGTVGRGDGALVAGLVVAAPAGVKKTLLIRAAGPSLTQFGVVNALPQTAVSLLDERGTVLARNSGWATNLLTVYTAIADTSAAVGAFALAPGSGDSALLVDVPRGNYTVSIEAAGGATTGVGLAEIYEVREDAGRLANLSVRGQVGAGGGFTVGFVARGAAAPNLLVRAIGPGLEQFGVTGALKRPVLTVFRGTRSIATNTGWTTAANSAQIEQAAVASGAFPLARAAVDSALLLSLLPGEGYTAQVGSADGTAGAVLVEIYQVF